MNTALLQRLWKRWGNPNYPAEWDGSGGNGGKGSQRFWEYLWTINQIGSPQSVLDVGGGTLGFFSRLLKDHGCKVFVVDPLIDGDAVHGCFNRTIESVNPALFTQVDWITCISVLEHVDDKPAFCRALDAYDCPIALTCEFGAGGIDPKTFHRCMDSFQSHHITKLELCPLWAENSAIDKWRPLGVVLLPNA